MDIIFIHDLKVETIIGIYDWERTTRQTVSVDVEMATDIRKAAQTDNIEHTPSYKDVAKRLVGFISASGFFLVETMAEQIATIILSEFPVPWVKLTLHKPGAVRDARDVGVIIERGTPLKPENDHIMPDVYLSLGSNINAKANICSAVQALRAAFGALRLSFVYQTPAMGFDGEDFLNLAVHFTAHNTPQALQQMLHTIENQHGRQRHTARFSARTLDIDILLYADKQLDFPGLKLPRDETVKYAFVLAPLADIASHVIHPQHQCSIGALWVKFCQDNSKEVGDIHKIPFSFTTTCHHQL